MVLGIDGDLDILADNAGVLAGGRHRAGIGIGQGDLFIGRDLDLLALELAPVDRNDRPSEQVELAAQHNERCPSRADRWPLSRGRRRSS